MKPKTMILMVVAVVCGLAASYMTSRLLAEKSAPPPVNTVTVLVAKQKINAWTPMNKPEDLFVPKDVPEGTFSPKCITDFKDLKGQALKAPLNEQMPVTKDDLLTEATVGLIAMLKPGQRAIAIRVNPESLAGGFVLPGSKVDVMFTIHRGDADSKTEIIQQEMLVLAVDQKNTRDEGQQSILGSTATLAATADQAQQLSLAASLGDLRLLLRSPLDKDHPKYKPVYIAGLGHQPREGDEPKPDSTDTASTGDNITAAMPNLPKVDPTPKPAAPVTVVKEDKAPVVVPPPPPEPVTHTLRIETGEDVTKTVFVWDDKNGCWEGGMPTKKSAAKPEDAPKSKEAAKPEDAPKPAPKAPAAPAGSDANQPVG